MSSIPAMQLVSVTPGVISAGGSALNLNGVLLTSSTRAPVGSILQFPNQVAVANYFGSASAEAAAAAIYFLGFNNSNVKPGNVLFAQYNTAAVGAYLRGGSLATMTLTQLQALSGTVIVVSNGTTFTSSTISLSAATSFSNAATIIQAAFTSPTFTVSFDSVSSAFVFTSTTTGGTSTMSYATGTISANLKLTLATGAVTSQGAAVAVPATFMNAFIAGTQNWASFTTLFDPDNGAGNTLKQAFAAWNNAQNNRYAYVPWDTDTTPLTTVPATTSLGYILTQNGTSGTILVYGVDYTKAVFVCGWAASLDFTEVNGRATLAFKGQAGLTPDVTDGTSAANLILNGYNFYGSYATANQTFQFMQPGSCLGQFAWADSYVNQIWLNNALQLAGMETLVGFKSIPYAPPGYAAIRAGLTDPIQQGLNFGAYGPEPDLSALQIAEVNALIGFNVAPTLQAAGYYLFVGNASAQVRAARTSPNITFLYCDRGSVQKLAINSTEVQ